MSTFLILESNICESFQINSCAAFQSIRMNRSTSNSVLNSLNVGEVSDIVEKLDFDRQFERYRYLQNLLDGDIEKVMFEDRN